MNDLFSMDSLPQLLSAAKDGDAVAAARAAALIYSLGAEGVERCHFSVDQFLSLALGSNDPEFLVALGDELVSGSLLPRKPDLALKSYQLADRKSPIMGAYALGRASFLVNPHISKSYFARAASHGHFPSLVLLLQLSTSSNFLLRPFYWVWKLSRETIAFARAYWSLEPRQMFWRYRDISPHGIGIVENKIGVDRTKYFLRP